MNARRRLVFVLLLPLGLARAGFAQPAEPASRPQQGSVDLASLSLADLMNIEISSVSRKEQRAADVPAAVYVITRDDIRRSGMTALPDLLRLVPGVQVAQINSNKWAVGVRGFNGVNSSKLLVLVDGRSIYNPLFASVLWDTEDLMLEDVDRIEVVRGAGGAIWGANAVNGVINIITKAAADTRGLLVRAGTGTLDPGNLAIRYGGTRGANAAYRAFVQVSEYGDTMATTRTSATDHWRSVTSGFRSDWSSAAKTLMLQGGLTVGETRPLWINLDPAAGVPPGSEGVSDTTVAHVLGRWGITRASGGTFELQSFVDFNHRRESIGDYRRHTVDVDANYHTAYGRHDLVSGGGFRTIDESIADGVGYSFNPSSAQVRLVNLFAQDEIALAQRRVKLSLGAKFEHSTYAGSGLQPTARAIWTVTPRQRVWGAISRALRTPSMFDRGGRVDFPPSLPEPIPGDPGPQFPLAISALGNPDLRNERLLSTEAGYRLEISSKATVDVAAFTGHYDGLITNEPSAPTVALVNGRPLVRVSTIFQNLLAADTRGVEISGRAAGSVWLFDGTFSAFHLTPHLDPASHDPVAPTYDGSAPTYQWRGRSALSLGPRAQADFMIVRAGPITQVHVPAYTRADARFEWKLTARVSATAVGQNLFSRSHVEFAGSERNIVATRVPRSASVRLTWRF